MIVEKMLKIARNEGKTFRLFSVKEIEENFHVKFDMEKLVNFEGVCFKIASGHVPANPLSIDVKRREGFTVSCKIVNVFFDDSVVVKFDNKDMKFAVMFRTTEDKFMWLRTTELESIPKIKQSIEDCLVKEEEENNSSDSKIVEIEGVKIVNTTPHAINFLSEKTGKEYQVDPCGFILNATPVEEVLQEEPVKLVKTVFRGNKDGMDFINSIPEDVIIVGSMIACNSYDRVVAMTPAKGFERVPPAEKKMNLFKFTV